jgi:hypothetical protein
MASVLSHLLAFASMCQTKLRKKELYHVQAQLGFTGTGGQQWMRVFHAESY